MVSGGYRLLYLHSTVIHPKFEFTDYFTCLGCDKTQSVIYYDIDIDQNLKHQTKAFKPKFEFFSNYSGIAYARVKFGNKVGYIKQDGTYLIEPKFEEGNNFDYDFAAVKLNNKWSFVKPNGSYLFALKFDDAMNFSLEGYTEGFAPVKLNEKWGYLKIDGTYLIEPKFKRAYHFKRNGYGAVLYNGEEKSVDSRGKILDIDYYNEPDIDYGNYIL